MTVDTELAETDAVQEDIVDEASEHREDRGDRDEPTPATAGVRTGLIVGLTIVLALSGLVGWLGYRFAQANRAADERALFVQAGRQAALNLTTIDYSHVDADVQRILDSSIAPFRDDFQKRSQPFIDVVRQAQSTTQGSITEAGLESMQGDRAQVLVAVSVKTSNAGAAQQEPRAWRMRVDVQKVGDGAKVSNVQFVP